MTRSQAPPHLQPLPPTIIPNARPPVEACLLGTPRLSAPLIFTVGHEVHVAAAEYELRRGRRRVAGWTVGTVHPLPGWEPRWPPIVEFKGAAGLGYAFLEGVGTCGIDRRHVQRAVVLLRRRWRSRGYGNWVVRHADIDEDAACALMGVPAVAFPTEAEVVEIGLGAAQAAFGDRWQAAAPDEASQLTALEGALSPARHAPLRAAIEAILARPRWPSRIVACWGAAHIAPIERDVWGPLGFELRSVQWAPGARLDDAARGAADVVIDAEFDPDSSPTEQVRPAP